MGKKIDIAALKPVVGKFYPAPFDEPSTRSRISFSRLYFWLIGYWFARVSPEECRRLWRDWPGLRKGAVTPPLRRAAGSRSSSGCA
jgi:hypothetical protein